MIRGNPEERREPAKPRNTRLAPDLHRAGLLRIACEQLQPGQKIGEVWSEADLADIEQRLVIVGAKYGLKQPAGVRGKPTILQLMREGAA